MKLYIDSNILVKLYYPEPESKQIEKLIKDLQQPLLFTPFHELEMTNAFALKVFRKEISRLEFESWQEILKKDKKAGILQIHNPDWPEVFFEALRISRLLSPQFGTRLLDIIHVAAAHILNCDTFLTHDARQSVAAQKLGLSSIDLPR